MSGTELLQQYAREGSEEAFAALVSQFAGLVYSTAFRRLQNAASAQDVAQEVFASLAVQPPAVARDEQLIGWLHRATVRASIDHWRKESRRQLREESFDMPDDSGLENQWKELEPLVDEAIDELKDAERELIFLRFHQSKSFRDISEILAVTEDAAKMRLGRTLDKVRGKLAARGIVTTTLALAAFLGSQAASAAPHSVIIHLLATKLGAKPVLANVTANSAVKSVMIMSKMKLAVMIGVGLLVLGGLGVFYHFHVEPYMRRHRQVNFELERVEGQNEQAAATGLRKIAVASTTNVVDLVGELRALLNKPPRVPSYPPPELKALIRRFGTSVLDAMPVLLEALEMSDSETRAWAMGGIEDVVMNSRLNPELQGLGKKAFAMAYPAISKILLSTEEPELLRIMVLQMYLPHQVAVNGKIQPLDPIDPGPQEDLIALLKNREETGPQFSVISSLSRHFNFRPGDALPFVSAISSLLHDRDKEQRMLAATALAAWPGDKAPDVKEILVGYVKDRCMRGATAVRALADIGATDTLPTIRQYAEEEKGSQNGSYQIALEAICRLDPETRSRNPEIDQRLKLQEMARDGKGSGFTSIAQWTLATSRAGEEYFRRGILAHLGQENVASQKVAFIEKLKSALPSASQEERVALTRAIKLAEDYEPSSPKPFTDLFLANLTADASMLVGNGSNPQVDRTLDKFMKDYPPTSKTFVTGENFLELSRRLRAVDPSFEEEWRRTIYRNYPWLDRVLPPDAR
jgi:RNA polymerase sigma factor (sigma-70 family)